MILHYQIVYFLAFFFFLTFTLTTFSFFFGVSDTFLTAFLRLALDFELLLNSLISSSVKRLATINSPVFLSFQP